MELAFDIGEQFIIRESSPMVKYCKGGSIGGKVGIGDIYCTLGQFISAILPNIYVISGIILFFLLIFGGLTFIVNAGKGEQEGAKKGQQAITAALLGFLLIFASWWIMEIIKIITGIDILGGGGL